MSGVWILTTAGRSTWRDVERAARANASADIFLFVWQDKATEGIGPLMQQAFERAPDADFYGWLADDTFPSTPGWNRTLEHAAGDWRLAYADDGGLIDPVMLRRGLRFSSGLCWGGELVRSVGWWALPGLTAAWIDVAWSNIVAPLGLYQYVPGVLVEHRHHGNGGRARDEIDERSRESIETTRGVYERWYDSERQAAIARVREQCPLALADSPAQVTALMLRAAWYDTQPNGALAARALRETAEDLS